MNLESRFNRILNEIITCENKAIFLLAPVGSKKSDFLTQLSKRYQTTYWFNPITEDLSLYCHTFIDKILKEDENLQFKLKQLLFSSSNDDSSGTIILSLLDYIKKQKIDTLMVFERMEFMPKDFDYSDFLNLIINAPPNLKIVFSSTEFLPFEWNKFEPNYPMFVDNSTLKFEDNSTPTEFLSGLTEEEQAFIYYISDLDAVNMFFLDNVYPNGAKIFKDLAKTGEYIVTRDVQFFRISPLLSAHLATQKNIIGISKRIFANNVKEAYGQHLYEMGHFFGSLTLFYESQCIEGFDKSFKEILREDILLLKVIPYIKAHPNFNFKKDQSKYKYYSLYRVMANIYCLGKDSCLAAEHINLSKYFKDKDINAYLVSRLFEFLCFLNRGEDEKIKEEFGKLQEIYSSQYKEHIFAIASFLPNALSYTGIPFKELEDFVLSTTAKEKFYYIKLVEDLAIACFFQGNYRKSLHYSKILTNYLDYYVMPPYFIALQYFLGEVEEACELVNDSLSRPIPIQKNIDILYTVKAMIEAYYGNESQANLYFDLAYKNLDYSNYSYYFTIMQRCLYYTKMNKQLYAKDLANIHLQQSMSSKLGISVEMLSSISYAFFKLRNLKLAHQTANACIQVGSNRSVAWLLGMGIATNILLQQGELKDAPTLVKNLLKASYNYGMKMLVADYADDIFMPILLFARKNGIEVEYIDQLNALIDQKKEEQIPKICIKVQMFGVVNVFVKNEELKWKTKKAKELFVQYIIAGESGIERSNIIELMWKDYKYESAINNLKTTNNIIRNTLSDYNIQFKLEYINSKYILSMKNITSDFHKLSALLQKYETENKTLKRVLLMNQVLSIIKDEFCKDMNYENIKIERIKIKQWTVINLLRLVKDLTQINEFLEAKKFLQVLASIDKSMDYTSMLEDINSQIVLI